MADTASASRPLPTGRVAAADVGADGLSVRFASGETAALQLDWLRDNCRCSRCRIAQTDERRYTPWTDQGPASLVAADVIDGTLRLTWGDGHTSAFGPAEWERLARDLARGSHDEVPWAAGHDLTRIDHDAATHDLDARRDLYRAFLRDGAVVVTGVPQVPGEVLTFAKTIGLTLLDSSLGFLFDVRLDPAGYNVAFTNEGLPLHNDNAQCTHPPSGQILSMVVNEATGGNTIVVDGWSVLQRLEADDPDAVRVLGRVHVGHRQYSPESDGFSRNPLVVRDRSGRFTHLRFSNQLLQPLPWDHPDLADWYRAYRRLGTLIHDPSSQVTFRLHGGEMLLVNGYRVLHARTAFTADGPRHLQDVYFSTDDVASALARLTGDAVNAMVHA